jgi:uncharacterized membrane protein
MRGAAFHTLQLSTKALSRQSCVRRWATIFTAVMIVWPACPWNKFAVAATEMKYAAREELKAPKLDCVSVF